MTDADLLVDDVSTEEGSEPVNVFYLVWLDAHAEENPATEDKLRSVIDQLETFADIEECQTYIRQRSKRDRIVVVVSGQLGRRLVPSIHQFRQVVSIYIYCMDETSNEEWARRYSKVKGVVTQLSDLLSQMASDHQLQRKIEEPLPMSIISSRADAGKTVAADNTETAFKQILIDLLLRLKSTDTDKNELISRLKKRYEENATELNNLAEFEKEYTPEKVLHWYTKKTFFYKALNAALRKEDIHMIFLFRSYIADIYRQLELYQSKQPIKVHRCQMMSADELETLENAVGQSISINSFFSTSRDFEKAYSFLRLSNILKRVIFDVEANPAAIAKTKPFADISKHSAYRHEAEILFMVGTIFHLESIQNDEKRNVSIVKIRFPKEGECNLREVHQFIQKPSTGGTIDLRTLAQFLYSTGKFALAKKYFIRSINELSSTDPLRADLYEDLSRVALQTGDHDQSLQYLHQSIEWKLHMEKIRATTAGKTPGELTWKGAGITIAGRDKLPLALSYPFGIFVTELKTVCVADWGNDRVVQWACDSKVGEIVADGNGSGRQKDQLSHAIDVVVDQRDGSYVICDQGNRRVVRWFYRNQTNQQVLVDDIACYGIAIDRDGAVYVSDTEKNEVRRWKEGETQGTVVAGGNDQGRRLNQLNYPTFLFVDDDYSLYVSDRDNHRVMRWRKGASEGVVVAGGNGYGSSPKQFFFPEGVFVDRFGHVYVADNGNNRIMRWRKGEKCGSIVIGGKGKGTDPEQLNGPTGISLDNEGNLYVVDHYNHRVQKYEVDSDENTS